MFRKYYKAANEDIKIDEALVDRVIANAHKKNPPARKAYYKYALPAAAAVLIISAAVVSMPVWQKVEDNSGVIIEESVTRTSPPQNDENTPQPNKSPDSDAAASLHNYDNSQSQPENVPVKKEEQTKKSNIDYSSSKKRAFPKNSVFSEPSEESSEKESTQEIQDKKQESGEVFSRTQKSTDAEPKKENTVQTEQDKRESVQADDTADTNTEETAKVMSENEKDAIYGNAKNGSETGNSGAASAENYSAAGNSGAASAENYSAADSLSSASVENSTYEEAAADEDSGAPAEPYVFSYHVSADSETADKSPSSGGASSSASTKTTGMTASKTNTAAPSGYCVTYEDGSNVTYKSEGGGEIYVNSDHGDYSDSDVVYNDGGDVITANFAENGVRYDITAYNAEMSSVEEVVDILR